MVWDTTKIQNPAWGQSTPAPTTTAAPKAQPNVFAGSTYGADANVGGVDTAGFLKDADPRDFMFGRDPNYAANTAAAERTNASNLSTDMQRQGQSAASTQGALGLGIANYAQGAAGQGQNLASHLSNTADSIGGIAGGMAGRAGPQANYYSANTALQGANSSANALAGLDPSSVNSGAQAQLQSGLNAAEASNLALARSGHGWGASASAMNQAIAQNAAAGQQATNQSALLQAQTGQFAQSQAAQNLNSAASLQAGLGAQYGQQALSNAQLQAQTMQANDQAQAAMYGLDLSGQNNAAQSYNAASQLGTQGLLSGAQTQQAGETLGMQGTQNANTIYSQGESLAGQNMTSQQQGDLARESGLLTTQGINSGLAVSNQNAINSAWGTGLSTAGTIGAATATALSDATAKTAIKPLDQAPAQKPNSTAALATPIAQTAGSLAGSAVAPGLGSVIGGAAGTLAGGAIANAAAPPAQKPSMIAPAAQAGGAVLGGAIGTAIAPGVGTVLGGLAGSALGGIAGHLLSSDITTKSNAAPVDVQPGYGMTNPSGSAQAGASNAFSAGRGDAAAAASKAAYAADLHAQAQDAATQSLLGSAQHNLAGLGANQGASTYNQFAQMGPRPYAPAPGGSFGPFVASDERAKNDIATSDATDMVEQAPGYSYDYIDPARHGYGRHFGPMAQDLAKTPAGASTLVQMPDGKLGVHTGRLALANHAALHTHQQELQNLRADLDNLRAQQSAQ